jgi:hypothetical protein
MIRTLKYTGQQTIAVALMTCNRNHTIDARFISSRRKAYDDDDDDDDDDDNNDDMTLCRQ